MHKTRRQKKGNRTIAVLGLLGSLIMVIGSVAVALSDPSPKARLEPIQMALVFAGFYGAMSFPSVWMLLAYQRERIKLSQQHLIHYGICRAACSIDRGGKTCQA